MAFLEHTYLVREGRWKISGQYYNKEGDPTPVEGVAQVVLQEKVWILDAQMQMSGLGSDKIVNRQVFSPPAPGQTVIPFIAQNPRLGRLEGRYTLVDDAILSHYLSQDGPYSGVETLLQQTHDTYLARGALYDGAQLIAAWAVRLTMVS